MRNEINHYFFHRYHVISKINIGIHFKRLTASFIKILYSLGLFASLAFSSASLQAASFNCAKADTSVERAICASPQISKLDDVMVGEYKLVKARTLDVVNSQRDWLRYRRNRCADDACLASAYQARIEQLRSGSWAELNLSTAPLLAIGAPQGDVVYAQTMKQNLIPTVAWLKKNRVLETTFMNAKTRYPFSSNLRIYAMDCNEVNAYYYASKAAVVMCYEMVGTLVNRAHALKREHPDFADERNSQILQNSIMYVLLHELGHAALQRSETNPGLAPEELEADAFASILMLDFQQSTQARIDAMFGVNSFAQIAKSDPTDIRAYSDDHFFSGQRYVNFVCLAIGNDSALAAPMVASNTITEQRAMNCPAEWRTRKQAVTRLSRPIVP